MVLLGFVRRVAAENQFSSARKSLRKLSGSALGVTERSTRRPCRACREKKRNGTAWCHIPGILCHVYECEYGSVVHQYDESIEGAVERS